MTVTKNEILAALNKPDDFILALVQVSITERDGAVQGFATGVHYVRNPFQREPDFGVTSVNYDWKDLLARAGGPA